MNPANHRGRSGLWQILGLLLAAPAAVTAFDLSRAEVATLDNGLTVAVLEDHTLPVVSVQMLYKVGARNEQMGRTGLAHYLEHMAFRATESFPDTEVVSAIYAVGGEWHGYTWIDQTTYFETVPREHLDLVLRIEAERLSKLLIPEEEVEVERGAVLSELHGYENDPASVLLDTVAAASFLQHPYRHNTIGWVSDVEKIEHQDLVDFYRHYYDPANAVLAVVGDVDNSDVMSLVRKYFRAVSSGGRTDPLRTLEPEQNGERRVQIDGQGGERRFVIAYRAPSVRSKDWPAFLVLQEVLGGGEGVNFLQNDWGVAIRAGARLDGIAEDLTTWYPPSFDPYLFVLSGTISSDVSQQELESRIQEQIDSLLRAAIETDELAAARARVVESLLFDVQTTEDAAHQLASYVGYGALTELLQLPMAIERVTVSDIQRLAATYLHRGRRTIGWYLPESRVRTEARVAPQPAAAKETPAVAEPRPTKTRPLQTSRAVEAPVVKYLSSGLPVVFQRVSTTPTAYLRLLAPVTSLEFPIESSRDWPVWGHTSLDRRVLSHGLETAAEELRAAWDAAEPLQRVEPPDIEDPGQRLEAIFRELTGPVSEPGENRPAAIVVVGDLELEASLEVLEHQFGDLSRADLSAREPMSLPSREVVVRLSVPRAQAQLGYWVPAPPPSRAESLAWRMILYVLAHGYEGRLGKEAIGRRGLIYYVDSSYRTDGQEAWITLAIGVDPPKLQEMQQLLVDSLADLIEHPPTKTELEEARAHFIGRWRSAAQSNDEISAALAKEWIGQGSLRSEAEFAEAVGSVQREDVLRWIPDFASGTIAIVEMPE